MERLAQVVTAFEHGVLPVGDGCVLGADDMLRLMAINAARPRFCTPGYRSVRLGHYVGLVAIGGRVLEILPKLGESETPASGRGVLLRLLRITLQLPAFEEATAGHDLRRDTLLDVFVAAFLASVALLVRGGLLQRYLQEEDDLPVVRGRLLMERQATVNGLRPDRVASRFDDLSANNLPNRVIRRALDLVRPLAQRPAARRLWLELNAAFDGVESPFDAARVASTLQLDRQSRHYAVPLRWARWILDLLTPNLRGGRAQAPMVLFDMNRLFESAVERTLALHAARFGFAVRSQDTGRALAEVAELPGATYFRLRPDYVVHAADRLVALADAKWTTIESDSNGVLVPSDAHAYQLNAYAAAYPISTLILIYPWHAGLEHAKRTSFLLAPRQELQPRLYVACLDVADDRLPFRIDAGLPLLMSQPTSCEWS